MGEKRGGENKCADCGVKRAFSVAAKATTAPPYLTLTGLLVVEAFYFVIQRLLLALVLKLLAGLGLISLRLALALLFEMRSS